MRRLIYLFAAIALIASSCKKGSDDLTPEPIAVAKNFKEIKTDPNFNWETTHEFTLIVKGLPTEAIITNTLKVTSVDGKSIYFTSLHQMNQSLTTKFIIPIDQKEILVQYGSINKKYITSKKQIDFDFTVENPE